jgi:hypothetical protein
MCPIAPQSLDMDRGDNPHALTIFTDLSLDEVYIDASTTKVAWLLEPPEIHPNEYAAIGERDLFERFDLILSHQHDLLRLDKRFTFMPFGGCWIAKGDWAIYPKQHNVSLIASTKTFLEGHQLRHDVVRQHGQQLDGLFGSAYQPVDDKLEALERFRYSMVIENVRKNYFFTEKLIDAFVTGTVPIYWGCPDIAKFFNPDGMVTFTDIGELPGILASLSEEDYQRRMPAIRENFLIAQRYAVPEDYLNKFILEPRFGRLV